MDERESGGTYLQCFQRLYSAARIASAERLAQGRVEELEKVIAASSNSSDQVDSAASLRDLLPGLITSFGLGELSEDDSSQSLTFNPDLGARWRSSLRLVRYEGEPWAPFVSSLAEDVREELVNSLGAEIGDFDDSAGELTISYEGPLGGRQFGRRLATGNAALANSVFEVLAGETVQAASQTGLTRLAQEENRLGPFLAMVVPPLEETKGELSGAALKREELIASAAEEEAVHADELQSVLDSGGYFGLAALIDNQPQLFASVIYRRREGVVGPSVWSASISYEHGFRSLNSAVAFAERRCGGDLTRRLAPGETCLASFLAANSENPKNRAALKVAYEEAREFSLEIPGQSDFLLRPTSTWVGSLVWGRSLRRDARGTDLRRGDVDVSYEAASGDAARRSRVVVTATLTQRLTDEFDFSVGAVWANRPEYRGEVDEELSARAGIKWKLDRKGSDE